MWSLDLRNITLGNDKVKSRLGDILKTTNVKNHQHEIKLNSYPKTKNLCIVHYLREYINRTKNLRGGGQAPYIH